MAAATDATTTDTAQAVEIKLIHIARRELEKQGKLDDAGYRGLLAQFGNGADSSKALTAGQRRRLLQHFKACGFKLRSTAGQAGGEWRREPQMRKLRALWYQLAERAAVDRPADGRACDAAIEAWAKRQLQHDTPPLDALRFASGAQMDKLIEALKAWGRRVGAEVL